jgi:hypothetical protein
VLGGITCSCVGGRATVFIHWARCGCGILLSGLHGQLTRREKDNQRTLRELRSLRKLERNPLKPASRRITRDSSLHEPKIATHCTIFGPMDEEFTWSTFFFRFFFIARAKQKIWSLALGRGNRSQGDLVRCACEFVYMRSDKPLLPRKPRTQTRTAASNKRRTLRKKDSGSCKCSKRQRLARNDKNKTYGKSYGVSTSKTKW